MAHHRKVELQSPADFTYLYANTIALSRRQVDLHLPPSAIDNETPDPMRERVRELVDDVSIYLALNPTLYPEVTKDFDLTIDQYIHKTFDTASASISINGIDSSSPQFPFPAAFTEPAEQVEFEAFDTELAARVTSLYAQLESLNTTVAQQRRDAPRRAAKEYAAQLKNMIREDEDYEFESENKIQKSEGTVESARGEASTHDTDRDADRMDIDSTKDSKAIQQSSPGNINPAWKLQATPGTEEEQERWKSGDIASDIASVYEDTLRMLLRLQGEGGGVTEIGAEGNALATTVGKVERAGRAAEVVENMVQ